MTGFDLFPITLDDRIVSVPWGLMEPHEAQAKLNHSGASLEQLAARGGIMVTEALAIIEDRKWERMALTAAMLMLKEYADAFIEDRPVRNFVTIDRGSTNDDWGTWRHRAKLVTLANPSQPIEEEGWIDRSPLDPGMLVALTPAVIDPEAMLASGEYYLGAPVKAPPPAPDILTRLDKAISLATRGRSVIGPGSRHTMNELVATLEGIKLELYGKGGE